MEVRFWGVRGSIAKSGPSTIRYGGNTSCVEVRSDSGTIVTLDCGTGAHGLGVSLMTKGPHPSRGHILISHTHWDHIQGIPFFAPLFVPGNEWDIYAPSGLSSSLRQTLAGQMQYTYFPITIEQLGATIRYHDLLEGTFVVGDIWVRTRYLNHTALTLGYRLQADGVSIVYSCDHEPHAHELASGTGNVRGEDSAHVEFLRDADLVIHDAQYTATEYTNKVGWGHSTSEYAVMMCRAAGVRQLALTHHDPLRTDDEVDRLVSAAQKKAGESLKVFGAIEGPTLTLARLPGRSAKRDLTNPSAFARSSAIRNLTILCGFVDAKTSKVLADAVKADDLDIVACGDKTSILEEAERQHPALLLLEDDPLVDAIGVAQSIRGRGDAWSENVPIITVSRKKHSPKGPKGPITDWLTHPFSPEYARTRMCAWLMRTVPRWNRAILPDDEEARIDSLHSLNVLDTSREERFDRITRLASIMLDVPIAAVSLIDRDRQWFKSCVGLEATETSRDAAFCAHAILHRETLVIPDTLVDDRFAENPLVIGGPRIRFYAGCPLTVEGGAVLGTLCCIDTRPRQPDERQLGALRDLASLVERELMIPSSEAI